MIQKILHFIWFGRQPDYCKFAINKFKELNPTFRIQTYFRTISEIEQIYQIDDKYLSYDNILLKYCINAILNLDSKYNEQILKSKNVFKLDFIQILADIFRLAVLNKYGGIYLDCDTYPLKPFDSLLMTKNFTVARHTYNNTIIPDNFFIGKDVNTEHITTYTQLPQLLQTNLNWWKNISFIQNKINFFKCKLINANNTNNSNFYIEHYNDNTWERNQFGQNRTPKCKFDIIQPN